MNRDTGVYTAALLGLASVAVLILAALWVTTDGFAAWSSSGASTSTTRSFSLTVEDPTSSEDRTIVRVVYPLTVSDITCVLTSGTSVTINPKHGVDRSGSGTAFLSSATAITSTTTGDSLTSFASATVAAGSYVWLETTAASGSPGELNCVFSYTFDT